MDLPVPRTHTRPMALRLRRLAVVLLVCGCLVAGSPARAAGPGLKLNVRTSSEIARVNDTIRYSLTIENRGGSVIRSVTVRDFVDAELDVLSVPIVDRVASAGLSDILGAEEIFWTINRLRPSEKVTVSYKAKIAQFGDGRVENVARASGTDGSTVEAATFTYVLKRACYFGRLTDQVT